MPTEGADDFWQSRVIQCRIKTIGKKQTNKKKIITMMYECEVGSIEINI